MSTRPDYFDKYSMIKFERQDGVLVMQLHTDGKPLDWKAGKTNAELQSAFDDVGSDRNNGVVIFTGTGDVFSGPEVPKKGAAHTLDPARPWTVIYDAGQKLQYNMLSIRVPVICAINGPVLRHCELPMLGDIVIATPDTIFQDSAHFTGGMVPGDGKHVVFTMLMGINRARYFMYTGQKMGASQALELGIVQEIHERSKLMARAHELAHEMMQQSDAVRHYTRRLLTEPLRKKFSEDLALGFALEGLGLWADSQSH